MTTMILNRENLGHGSDELGQILMGSFLRKLWASADKPHTMAFYNSGVKLLAAGSPVADALDGLAQAGVELIACGTCVKYYGLDERLSAGRISDMQEIVGKLMASEKVITL